MDLRPGLPWAALGPGLQRAKLPTMSDDDALPDHDGPAQNDVDALVPSRTAKKREAEHRKLLGTKLTTLSADQLAKLELPERLTEALTEFSRLRARGAKRRQLQFIAALMRELDPEPIEQLMDELEGQSASSRYIQHQTERWRDRLLAEPAALTEFIDEYPTVDRQQLRQRLDKARKSAPEAQQTRARRELFRALREPIEAAAS